MRSGSTHIPGAKVKQSSIFGLSESNNTSNERSVSCCYKPFSWQTSSSPFCDTEAGDNKQSYRLQKEQGSEEFHFALLVLIQFQNLHNDCCTSCSCCFMASFHLFIVEELWVLLTTIWRTSTSALKQVLFCQPRSLLMWKFKYMFYK